MKNATLSLKSLRSLFLAIPVMIVFNSCSGYVNIEKRHYRSGYYVSKSKSADKAVRNEIPESNPFSETEIPVVLKPVVMDTIKGNFIPQQTVTINSVSVPSNVFKKKSIVPRTAKVQTEESAEHKVVKQENKKTKEKPDEKKRKKRAAITLFSVSALLLIFGFLLVPVGWFFILLSGILTAGGFAMLFSKNKETENTSADNDQTGESHHKNKKGKGHQRGFFLPLILLTLAALIVIALFIFVLALMVA